jgi:hypothetical protein
LPQPVVALEVADLVNTSPPASWNWYPVVVRWPDGAPLEDEIQGLNHLHALTRARWNWPHASSITLRT